MATVLIVDDEEALCAMFAHMVKAKGHTAHTATSLRHGLAKAEETSPDVIVLDVHLPDGSGLDAISRFQQIDGNPEIIVLTGIADGDTAELAVKSNAWAYIVKGFAYDKVLASIQGAIDYRQEKRNAQPERAPEFVLDGIVGSSNQMHGIVAQVCRAADSDVTVLITGETGTGKELFARAIHANSARKAGRFVVVDCASLPESLVEAILFGHVKGSFTGAAKDHEGLIAQANGGTLFMDEVGELTEPIQRRFLRALQERRFRPVGATGEVSSDFRLVAATNRNLNEMEERHAFRSDLLYRLKSFAIHLPPLREHPSDIYDLIGFHLARIYERHKVSPKNVSSEVYDALTEYPWPGNVRELVQTLTATVIAAHDSDSLYPIHLPESIRIFLARTRASAKDISSGPSPASPFQSGTLATYKEARERALLDAERQYFEELLRTSSGDVAQACSISGLSRSRLYELLKKNGFSGLG